MKDQKGFTLIEAMIIFAIVAILAALAVPYCVNSKKLGKMRLGTQECVGNQLKASGETYSKVHYGGTSCEFGTDFSTCATAIYLIKKNGGRGHEEHKVTMTLYHDDGEMRCIVEPPLVHAR